MKKATPELKAHLAQPYQTMTMCWLCKRTDGTVIAVSEFNRDLTFSMEAMFAMVDMQVPPQLIGTGTQTYLAASGFTSKDIATNCALNVDIGEAQGLLQAPGITEADMLTGLWDYAALAVFRVNWADLSMGLIVERIGNMGEINTDRGYFRAEWLGRLQNYQLNVGRLAAPMCDAIFGDDRCKKDLTLFTFTGTLTGASPDKQTFFDTGRTEPGPTVGPNITGVTNANPGVITMDSLGNITNGIPVVLAGIRGPVLLNTTTIVRGLSGLSWNLPIDTTDTAVYPAYTGGGTVTPLGSDTGYFDFGIFMFTSGPNIGRSFEIKNYTVGQWTSQLPTPFQASTGETYIIIAGCDKSIVTCRVRFANALNHRGLPFMSGLDAMVQVGRHT